ncbi:MAG TPA: M13 family metallopeptidase [Stenomitos sp.]
MRKSSALLALGLAATLCLPAFANITPPYAGADTSIRPQDDLFRFSNGQWLDTTEIPGDRRSYGTFMELRDKAQANVRLLVEDAAAHPAQDKESQLIGDFYASMMDLPTLDKLGVAPLKGELAALDQLKSTDDVATAMARLLAAGVATPVNMYVDADAKDPNTNVVYWVQGGLGLPNRDYYLKPGADSEALRTGYRAYMRDLFRMAGVANPEQAAQAAFDFELALAKIQWNEADRRDSLKTYNPTARDRWAKDYGPFPWTRYAAAGQMPENLGSVINEPSYLKAFAELAAKTPVETWKVYLQGRLLDSYAAHLSDNFRTAWYQFKGQQLQGLQTMPPRWRTSVEAADEALGEAIGARYVAKYFPPESKARMKKLVDNLLVVYKQSLENLSWMTPETRKAAVDKLSKLRVKIGYPDTWRGYEGLVIKREDAVGNLIRASQFDFARQMAEAGKPVDKSRWHMTPQTVNAYYSPVGNEIVFPAAILQPPFFDPKADDAYNYGAIGAVIGHEISHGFDDEGRHYDGEGRLRDWWTPADEKAFVKKAEDLISQYSTYEPLPGMHVDGRLTLGENIADLAGVSMAIKAYHLSLGGKKSPVIGDLTGDQRFFLGYARVWRAKDRPEWARAKIVTDPHSPARFRTNGVVTNLDAFYDAFQVKPGDKLFKQPGDRIRIW